MNVLLVAYDNDSYIHHFPLGTAYIASVLEKSGHEVTIYHQDQYHYPEIHLANYIEEHDFDVIGLGIIAGYYPYRKLLKISDAINSTCNRPFYILGGHGPSPEPEYFLKKTGADAIVIGEGEQTIIELLDALEHSGSLASIDGLAFLSGTSVIRTGSRQLLNVESIPHPSWHLFPMDYYALLRAPHTVNSDRVAAILSGRGCQFHCNFCYRMDEGLRIRSSESIVTEMEILKKDYGITYVNFEDELLMTSPARIADLCETFIKANLGIRWNCNGRLNYANTELLKLMKRAGCVFINYGIESMDDTVLATMNKKLNTDQIIRGVEATLEIGISPGLNIIFGNIGETAETLQKGVEFLLKYDNQAQLRTIRPVTPYPGCDLYYYAIEHGLLEGVEDFYENKHLNSDLLAVNFTELPDDEVHRLLFEANSVLLKNFYQKQSDRMLETSRKLYLEKDTSFRGYRQT